MAGDRANSSIVRGDLIWNVSLATGFELAYRSLFVLLIDMLNGGNIFGFSNDTTLLQTRVASFVLIYAAVTGITDDAERAVVGVQEFIQGFRYEALDSLFHIRLHTYETRVYMGVERTLRVGSRICRTS